MDNVVFPMPDMFDIEKISEIAYRNLEAPNHQRTVDNEPYMYKLREQYPWLGYAYHVYKPLKEMPLHVDSSRTCCINIPVKCDNSETIVYEYVNERMGAYDEKRKMYNISEEDVKEIYRFTLTEPVLFNTSLPHKVEVTGTDRRISISWNVTGTFNEIKNKYIHASR
tara:strand:+ start:3349 stop:3849 length:501 start_codon:yes stop_codon:yes gene_type:complete